MLSGARKSDYGNLLHKNATENQRVLLIYLSLLKPSPHFAGPTVYDIIFFFLPRKKSVKKRKAKTQQEIINNYHP